MKETILLSLQKLFLTASQPLHVFILLVGVIMFLDTYIGARTIYKTDKKNFSVLKLFGGLIKKMAWYTPLMVSIYILDVLILNSLILTILPIPMICSYAAVFLLSGKELVSIDTHWKILTGKSIVEWIKSFFDFVLNIKEKINEIKNKK